MNDDVFNAVVGGRTLRDLRQRTTAAVTSVTPAAQSNVANSAFSFITGEDIEAPRAAIQARAAYAAADRTSMSGQGSFTPGVGWGAKELTIRGALLLGIQALEVVWPDPSPHASMISRVQRYATRCDPPMSSCIFVSHNYPTVGAFALQVAMAEPERWDALGTFNVVQPLEQYDARALRLFAELQNGAALGRASAQRLRELQDAAMEDGEPLSLDALEALVAFATEYPEMTTPDLTLTADGAILAEWRHRSFTATVLFDSPTNVQYLVKRKNPRHVGLSERFSGTTTVDLVGERLPMILSPAEWPIRV